MTTEVRFVLDDEMAAALQKRAKMDFSTRTSVVKKALAEYLFSEKTPRNSNPIALAQEAPKAEALVRTPADERKRSQLVLFKKEKDAFLSKELIGELEEIRMFGMYDGVRPIALEQRRMIAGYWTDLCSRWHAGVSRLEAQYGIKPGTKGGFGIHLGGNPNPDWDVFSERPAKLAEDYATVPAPRNARARELEKLVKDFYSDPSRWKDGKYVNGDERRSDE